MSHARLSLLANVAGQICACGLTRDVRQQAEGSLSLGIADESGEGGPPIHFCFAYGVQEES